VQNVRIIFSKTDNARFISHLDLVRCFQRAFQRANIPIIFTEGFNPKPYMTFAMPLSLGIEGLNEILDIKVKNMGFDEIKIRLEKEMPEGIKILSCHEPEIKASEVGFSQYIIEIKQRAMSLEAFDKAVYELLTTPGLTVSKLGKQGKRKVVKEISLTENIQSLKNWNDNRETNVITMILTSNNSFGINPFLVLNLIEERLEISFDSAHIIRKKMLTLDGKDFYSLD